MRFSECEDLTIQLAALDPTANGALALALQGSRRLSVVELVACFALPSASVEEDAAAGFSEVRSLVPRYFEQAREPHSPYESPPPMRVL